MKYNIASGYAFFRDYITVIAFPDDGTDAWDYDCSQIGFYDASVDKRVDWGSHNKEWYASSQCMAYSSISDD